MESKEHKLITISDDFEGPGGPIYRFYDYPEYDNLDAQASLVADLILFMAVKWKVGVRDLWAKVQSRVAHSLGVAKFIEPCFESVRTEVENG